MSAREVRPVGGRWPVADRSLLPTVLGLPPLAAVGIATALTAGGAAADLLRIGSLGMVFTVSFIAGCVLAVAWVRRSGLFGPMVQPPLLVAVVVPVIVLLAGTPPPGAGVAEQLLVIGAPLVNAFPVMAWATGAALLLGLVRLVAQRPLRSDGADRPARKRAAEDDGAKPDAKRKRSGKDTRRRPTGEGEAAGKGGRRPVTGRRPVSGRRPRGGDAAPGEGRKSGSPRRS